MAKKQGFGGQNFREATLRAQKASAAEALAGVGGRGHATTASAHAAAGAHKKQNPALRVEVQDFIVCLE